MAGPTVYENVTDDGENTNGTLFADKKFWVAQRVPTRNHILDLIRSNGGQVVMLEKNADYMIADHLRRDCPPGTISYTFVDRSVKHGTLENPDDHPAGPPLGTVRAVGSTTRPARSMRKAVYTAEEDRILYNWVQHAVAAGAQVKGNKIYQQLAENHPTHPWQSWRSRYIDKLSYRPASEFTTPVNASSAKQANKKEPPVKSTARANKEYSKEELDDMFGSEDWEQLYGNVELIMGLDSEDYLNGWRSWAENTPRSMEQWMQYFEKVVRPQWARDPVEKRERVKAAAARKLEEENQDGDEQAGPKSTDGATKAPQKASVSESEEAQEESLAQHIGHQLKSEPTSLKAVNRASGIKAEPSEVDHERFEDLLRKNPNIKQWNAYVFFSRERKCDTLKANPGFDYADLHALLMSQWENMSPEEKATYYAMEALEQQRRREYPDLPPSPEKKIDMRWRPMQTNSREGGGKARQVLASASRPARPRIETREDLERAYADLPPSPDKRSAQKRLREESGQSGQALPSTPRLAKRQKNKSPTPKPAKNFKPVSVTQSEIIDLSSAENSDADEGNGMKPGNEVDEGSNVSEDVDPKNLAPGFEPPSSDLPSNSPTPKARRHQGPSAFDTQAILSSPDQSFKIDAIPRPRGLSQIQQPAEKSSQAPRRTPSQTISRAHYDVPAEMLSHIFPQASTQLPSHRSSSPEHPSSPPEHQSDSDASTTHSMQEFRRSLNDELDLPDQQPANDSTSNTTAAGPLPERTTSPSPSSDAHDPTTNDDDDSIDPDPPLTPSEFEPFFADQRAAGFADNYIATALKCTRFRPELALKVLEEWKHGRPLPRQRGIWSAQDDEAVESGDGYALALVQRKHSLDGWGGVTERTRFLDMYRGRGGVVGEGEG